VKLKRTECVEMNPRKVWKLLHGRRGVSAVVSNVILTGAVIAVSFVVLAWTQYRSSAYNDEYSEAMDADIARLKERLAFEYVFYDQSESKLSVYLMNCGTINDTTVKTVYVTTNVGEVKEVFSNIKLMDFNDVEIVDQDLDRGEEGYFMLSSLSLESDSYSVRVVTGRGSAFDHTFIVEEI
jgi:hypothetical protein